MSIAALKWVIDDAEAPTAHATLVLIIYANFANEHGRAYPSTETVGKKTKQNVKTVRAAIDALEDAGLLVDTGKRVGRTGNVKVYALGMEGLPEVGALPGEITPEGAMAPQEAPQAPAAQARPKTGALKAPVSGSKGTRFRGAEPVLEPVPLEDASASSSPRRGAKERCGTEDQGWQVPAIADLPPEARRVAEQWPAGAYAQLAAGHAAYCAGRGGRRRDPGRTWVARVIELGARPTGLKRQHVGKHLLTLREAGLIDYERNRARSISLVDRGAMLSDCELELICAGRGWTVTKPAVPIGEAFPVDPVVPDFGLHALAVLDQID